MFKFIKRFLCGLFSKAAESPDNSPAKTSETPQQNTPIQETACSVDSTIKRESNAHRKEDHSAEAELALFLDKYLYDRFPTGSSFSSIRRVQNEQEQKMGVDVEFIGNDGRVYCVDEKAQLHYLNKNLPTFAFELLSYQKGYDTIGWLCNPKLKTDLFLLVWPFATTDDYQGITWNQFTRADCLLIQKQKVLRLLASKGLTVERLLSDARRIRLSGQKGKIPIPGIKGIYYYASYPRKYQEAPINVVVSKALLNEIAQRRYIVTTDSVVTE